MATDTDTLSAPAAQQAPAPAHAPGATRRGLLGLAAAAGALGAGPALAAHPDAGLFKAWDDYLAVCRARDAIPHEQKAAYEAAWAEIDRLELFIAETPAETPAGQYVKLRAYFLLTRNSAEEVDYMLGLGPRPDDLLADRNDRLLWGIMEDARRLAGDTLERRGVA